MAEPEVPPLTEEQVARLTSAVEAWVERHPYPDYPAFGFADREPFSPRQLQDDLYHDGPVARQFLRMTRFALEVEDFDVIVARFESGQVDR